MRNKLLVHACVKFLAGLLLVGLMLFVPAGTLRYTNGWLFIALLFGPMLVLGAGLWLKAPELLEKRLQSGEKESAQRKVVGLSGLVFVGGFVLAGLDYRFGWSELPDAAIIAASVVLLVGYGVYAEVMRENAYLSRTVEVQENQRVIDSGLYGVVRHPMYAATVLMFLSMPIVLGSFYAFLIFLVYPALIAVRIRSEEAVLTAGLVGYAEYKSRVRFRLIPFIW